LRKKYEEGRVGFDRAEVIKGGEDAGVEIGGEKEIEGPERGTEE
jgi:hypothetical protein